METRSKVKIVSWLYLLILIVLAVSELKLLSSALKTVLASDYLSISSLPYHGFISSAFCIVVWLTATCGIIAMIIVLDVQKIDVKYSVLLLVSWVIFGIYLGFSWEMTTDRIETKILKNRELAFGDVLEDFFESKSDEPIKAESQRADTTGFLITNKRRIRSEDIILIHSNKICFATDECKLLGKKFPEKASDLKYVAFLYQSPVLYGEYTDGSSGYRYEGDVLLYSLPSKKRIWEYEIIGYSPPHQKKRGEDKYKSQYGNEINPKDVFKSIFKEYNNGVYITSL